MMMAQQMPVPDREFWKPPELGWFDYFVHRQKFKELLAAGGSSSYAKEELGRLVMQFTEQALICEKDAEIMTSKAFSPEDVAFLQRKSACHWLCAMSAFAGLQYDIDYIIDNCDILTLRVLLDRALLMLRQDGDKADGAAPSIFAQFLYDRWVFTIDRRYRLPPPPPKAVVNNPNAITDYNYTRHENIRRMVTEIRARISEAITNTHLTLQKGKEMVVPGVGCFFNEFFAKGGMSLSVGMEGFNVLYDDMPLQANLKAEQIMIAPEEMARKCRADLICYYFAHGDLGRTKDLLRFQVSPLQATTSNSMALMFVEDNEMQGYCRALCLDTNVAVAVQGTSTEKKIMVADQALLTNDSSIHRRLSLRRRRAEKESTGQLQVAFRCENMARDVIEGNVIQVKLTDKVMMERFVKSISRQLATIRDPIAKDRVDALLFLLCATVVGFKEELIRAGWDKETLRSLAVPPQKTKTEIVDEMMFPRLLSSDNPFWTVITSFDEKEIGAALTAVAASAFGDIKELVTYQPPYLLGSAVLSTRPVNKFHMILLGKLQQLADLKNNLAWDDKVNKYIGEIGVNATQNAIRFLFEAVRVRTKNMNDRIFLSHEYIEQSDFDTHLRTLKTLFNDSATAIASTSHTNQMTVQALTYALNLSEWEFVVQRPPDPNINLLVIMKLLAACEQQKDPKSRRKVCETLVKQLAPYFENHAAKRRSDGTQREREMAKARVELIQLLRVIKVESLLNCLMSYLCHIFNGALISDRKPQLRLHIPQMEFFGSDIELAHPHLDTIDEALQTVIKNALSVNPTNISWLRSTADYKYAKNELEEASVLYMETLLASDFSLNGDFPENIVDDTMWLRLRVCMSRARCHTLAALVSQMLTNKKEEEYVRASELLLTQTSLDASSECAPLVFDHILAEYLSDIYEKMKQSASSERLVSWMYRPCMNPYSSRPEVLAREQKRRMNRLLRTLAAQLFAVHL